METIVNKTQPLAMQQENNTSLFDQRLDLAIAANLPDAIYTVDDIKEDIYYLLQTIDECQMGIPLLNNKFSKFKSSITLLKILMDIFKVLPASIKEHLLNKGIYETKRADVS